LNVDAHPASPVVLQFLPKLSVGISCDQTFRSDAVCQGMVAINNSCPGRIDCAAATAP